VSRSCVPLLLLSVLIITRVAATLVYVTPLLIFLLKLPVQKGTPSGGIAAQVLTPSWSVRLILLLTFWDPVPNWLTDTPWNVPTTSLVDSFTMGQAERTERDEAVGCLRVSETGRYKQDPELTRP